MEIKQIKISKLCIPLIRPFITALRQTEHVEDIVISIECSNGLIGYGSAASTPVITGDTQESIVAAISQIIAPRLLTKSLHNFEELLLMVQNSMINNTSAKAAVDMALHDLFAKSLNIPLYKFLGGGDAKLKIVNTVSVKDVAGMVEDAKLFISQGFETLKVKVGLDPQQDIVRLKSIRQAVGKNIKIICDANQGWDAKAALQIIDSLFTSQANIAMVEQPVKAWDYANLKYIRDHSCLPIYADEAIFNLRDAAKIIANQMADGLNIKLMKSGGLYQARSIYDLATQHQVPCMAGCMLESPVGLAAMASFVAGRSNIKFIDLDPITMIKNNPIKGGITLAGAMVQLADAPGLGIEYIENLESIITL